MFPAFFGTMSVPLFGMSRWLAFGVLVVFILPLALHAVLWTSKGWPRSWRDADWSSAGILAKAGESEPATVRIYAARTGGWKGIFATHTWIVLKRAGASRYDRYDVVGWGSPVRRNAWAPDGLWYGNPPELVKAIDGPQAEALIPEIEAAVAAYRWSRPGDYSTWPGPNSNTFVAFLADSVPGLGARLPATAIGRDFPADGRWLGRTALGGWRATLGGYAGLAFGLREGVEIHFLGLVFGADFLRPALILPGFGRLGLPPGA